jgi:ATP-binding cassette subfamily B protein
MKNKKAFFVIFKYIKPYWKWAILAPIFMIIEVLMELQLPRFLGGIIDDGVLDGNIKVVIFTSLKMLAFSIVSFIGGILCAYCAVKASVDMANDIRRDLYSTIQKFSFNLLDNYPTGNLITRFVNDINQIQRLGIMTLRIMIKIPLLMFGSMIMAYMTSPKLFFIVCLSFPILLLSIYIVMKLSFGVYNQVQENLDGVNRVVQENLSGIKTVKAFVRNKFEEKRFKIVNMALKEQMIKGGKIVSFEMPFIMLILNISIVSVLYLGGSNVVSKNMNIGQVVAFVNYLQMMLMSLMFFSMLVIVASRSRVSIVRVANLLKEKDREEINEGSSCEIKEGNIEFENVSFYYNGSKDKAIDNISFSIDKGQTLAIIGRTGSGKSTLANMIPRFYRPCDGNIKIDGINLCEYKLSELRKNIGMVFQKPFLFSGTLRENIAFGYGSGREGRVEESSYISCSDEFIEKMGNGYETYLEERGENLSGGQKQRLSIGRALALRPKILILDDSTSAVDLKTELKIKKRLIESNYNPTIIIIAQRINSIKDADKIILIESGKIIDIGNHKELMLKSKDYRDIYFSQLGGDNIE